MSDPLSFPNNFAPYEPNLVAPIYAKIRDNLEFQWYQILPLLEQIGISDNSIYTGSAGIVLLHLKRGITDPRELVKLKALLRNHSLDNRTCTFLLGDAGPLCMGAIIDHKLGDHGAVFQKIQKLQQLGVNHMVLNPKSKLADEFLYGRAGYLYSLIFVNKHIFPAPIPGEFIRAVVQAILESGQRFAQRGNFGCPLMYQWHHRLYLGAAHGLSGILYLLLEIREYLSDQELNSLIRPSVDFLGNLRFPSGNYPIDLGDTQDIKVQWCHGAPGFVSLFCSAYKVFGDPRYLTLAVAAAEVVWRRGLLRKGYSICHGVAGNAYCFLELYQTTGDQTFLYRALRFAEYCLEYDPVLEGHYPDNPLSLFEGLSGRMYLLLDIVNPLEARFPGFSP